MTSIDVPHWGWRKDVGLVTLRLASNGLALGHRQARRQRRRGSSGVRRCLVGVASDPAGSEERRPSERTRAMNDTNDGRCAGTSAAQASAAPPARAQGEGEAALSDEEYALLARAVTKGGELPEHGPFGEQLRLHGAEATGNREEVVTDMVFCMRQRGEVQRGAERSPLEEPD